MFVNMHTQGTDQCIVTHDETVESMKVAESVILFKCTYCVFTLHGRTRRSRSLYNFPLLPFPRLGLA